MKFLHIITVAALCIGVVQITTPRINMVQLVEEDPEMNLMYVIGSGTEYECQPDPTTLTYKAIGGAQGVTLLFDPTLVNILYIRESGDNDPFIGFNLKNTETLRLGGFDTILIRRDEVAVYAKMEDL